MTTNSRLVDAPPQAVWDVLANGWLYPGWVVGATRIRAVDPAWPAEGAKIHHSVGIWPLVLDDNTEVLESNPPALLRLRARGWPAGEAEVVLRLTAEGAGCRVEISEKAVAGPGVLVPAPIEAVSVKIRNVETLKRLAFLAEKRGTAPDS